MGSRRPRRAGRVDEQLERLRRPAALQREVAAQQAQRGALLGPEQRERLVEERLDALDAPGVPVALRRGSEAVRPLRRLRREQRRALERRGRRRVRAAVPGVGRERLQIRREDRVRTVGRGRAMPGAALAVEDVGEREVGASPRARPGRAVDRGAHEGMAQRDAQALDPDEPGRLQLVERVRIRACLDRRQRDRRTVLRVVGGDEERERLSVRARGGGRRPGTRARPPRRPAAGPPAARGPRAARRSGRAAARGARAGCPRSPPRAGRGRRARSPRPGARRRHPRRARARASSGSPFATTRSRDASRSATPPACRRRPAKTIASADARSSHWASSTMQSTPPSSDARPSSPWVASETRKRSSTRPARRPNAHASACACGSGSRSSRPSTGCSSACSPAYASSLSDSTPVARNTRRSPASATACSSSVDLPTPGSPRTTIAPPSASSARSRARSTSLPKSTSGA